MNFRDIQLKPEYRSRLDDIVQDFYNPILKRAIIYSRAVGFFSSSALFLLRAGICGLLENGGLIQIITSPKLSQGDIAAIRDGLFRRDKFVERNLIHQICETSGRFEEAQLNFLSNLIAAGRLEIKIALIENDASKGIFHEKLGLLRDQDENVVAFTGSMNETSTAFTENYEAIDVFTSWNDTDRVNLKQSAFNAMWKNFEPGINVVDFLDVDEKIFLSYKFDSQIDTKLNFKIHEDYVEQSAAPIIPAGVQLRQYQLDAIKNWAERNYVGIFDMATGTGKTYAALAAVSKLFSAVNKNLAVIIICPYQHLVEQWKKDILAFGMKPLVCYSASSQKNWQQRLKVAVASFNLGLRKHFCMVTTNATFSGDYVQNLMAKLNGNVVIVVDEAHNFGAENLSKTLLPQIPYRLALSATIDRHGDLEGTQKLYDYFGEKCIEYPLKKAIDNDMLTPYHYYPILVSFNDEEREYYLELTEKIQKSIYIDKNNEITLSEATKMLLIKRARIVAGAVGKISVLRRLMENYKDKNQILVYCGATTMRDIDYHEGKPPIDEARQIDIVAEILGNELGMRVSKFTSEETAEEREQIKKDFAAGINLQAIVAMRCLDEGVNIPSIQTAFILASSTNPREYVQRRGRVLRKFAGKRYAEIFDFVTLPIPLEQVKDYDADAIKNLQSLAKREIARVKDFADIAENPFESDFLIAKIKRAYNIESAIKTEEGCGYD